MIFIRGVLIVLLVRVMIASRTFELSNIISIKTPTIEGRKCKELMKNAKILINSDLSLYLYISPVLQDDNPYLSSSS